MSKISVAYGINVNEHSRQHWNNYFIDVRDIKNI